MVSSVPGVPTNVSVVKLSPEIFGVFEIKHYRHYSATGSTGHREMHGDGSLIFFDAVSCCFTLFLATAEGTRYTIFVLVIP